MSQLELLVFRCGEMQGSHVLNCQRVFIAIGADTVMLVFVIELDELESIGTERCRSLKTLGLPGFVSAGVAVAGGNVPERTQRPF